MAHQGFSPEVRPLGIRVLIVEPRAFRTSFSGDGLYESAALPEYEDTVGPTRRMIKGVDGAQPGGPTRAAAAIMTAIDVHDAPLRLPPGGDAVDRILEHLHNMTQEVRAWEDLACATASLNPRAPSRPLTLSRSRHDPERTRS